MIKYNLNNKVKFLIKILFFYSVIFLKVYADDLTKKTNQVTLGNDDAPVKIKIFSSFTCPHCADFHINVLPEIKEKYLHNNKVQLIFIDFPLDQPAFNASKLLHCVDKKKQLVFLDQIYERQQRWTSGSNLNEVNNNLKEIVKNLGMNSNQFEKCLNNDEIPRYNHGERCDVRYSLQSMKTNENGENQGSQVMLRLSRCRLLYVDQVHLLPVPAS